MMLPSSQGLFRSIPCPFFLAGFCDRPHCFFRHCKSDIQNNRRLESNREYKDAPIEDNAVTNDYGALPLQATLATTVLDSSVNNVHVINVGERRNVDKRVNDETGSKVKHNYHPRLLHQHKRPNDTSGSVSSSSPSHKRPRASSSCNEDQNGWLQERGINRSLSDCGKGKDYFYVPPKENDGSNTMSHNDEFSKSVPRNNNRSKILVGNSIDVSTDNSDVSKESLEDKPIFTSYSENGSEMVARELFENHEPKAQQKPVSDKCDNIFNTADGIDAGYCAVGKKRVAHANVTVSKYTPVVAKKLQDTMFKRFEEQSKSQMNVQVGNISTSSSTLPKPGGKVRFAHVHNAGESIHKPVTSSTSTSASHSEQRSLPGPFTSSLMYSQTVTKGVKREAHKASMGVDIKQGPVVIKDALNKSSKIPYFTRQQIMDKMFAEYCRVFDSREQAFKMTVTTENELMGKCDTKPVYYSSGISVITRLRKASTQREV